jgi:hypothetical protein
MIINGSTALEVFRFKSTGLVALCQEVADYVASGRLDEVDLSSARFVETDSDLIIRFNYKEEDDISTRHEIQWALVGASRCVPMGTNRRHMWRFLHRRYEDVMVFKCDGCGLTTAMLERRFWGKEV